MNGKNLDRDFLSIKEFAELVDITIPTLRHYDNTGVFRSAKHGIESESKYRYYSPMQITTVKMIRVLTEIGVPLQTIKELAQSRTPEKLMKLLSGEQRKVVDKLRFLNEVHSVIDVFMDLLTEGICATETELSVYEMPAKQIILGGKTDFQDSEGFLRAFMKFCNSDHEPTLNLSYPIGGYFENMELFLNEPSRPARFFSLDPKGHDQKAEGLYLIGYTRGYYGQTNDLPERMNTYAKKNGLIFNGAVYNIYLFDELSISDPEQYLLQVSAPVTETKRLPSRRP